MNKWKKLVEQEKNSKLQKSKLGSPASGAASSPPITPSAAAAPAAASHSVKKFTGNPETRKYDADGVDTKRTDSTVRNSCIGLIYNGLAYRSTASESDVLAKSVAVEAAAFSHFKGEGADYKKKIRSLFTNLKNKSNRALGVSVMASEIPPERFVAMTDDDLKSDDQRKKEIELEKENMKKAQVPMAEKSISDSLECGKCKKKKVSYTQAQTRSADEPMTTFCECMNCGNRWKVRLSFPLVFYILVYLTFVGSFPDSKCKATGWRLHITIRCFFFNLHATYFLHKSLTGYRCWRKESGQQRVFLFFRFLLRGVFRRGSQNKRTILAKRFHVHNIRIETSNSLFVYPT